MFSVYISVKTSESIPIFGLLGMRGREVGSSLWHGKNGQDQNITFKHLSFPCFQES